MSESTDDKTMNNIESNINESPDIRQDEWNNIIENLEENGGIQYVFPAHSNAVNTASVVIEIVFSAAFLILLFISCCIIAFSQEYSVYGIAGTVISIVVIVLNFLQIVTNKKQIGFCERYGSYEKILKYVEIELVEDISTATNIKPEAIVKDLKKAVEDKLIPQGHFGTDDLIFIVSDEAYERYEKDRDKYDGYYRNLLQEHRRMNERTPDVQKLIDDGETYIKFVKECEQIVPDTRVKGQMDELSKILAQIYHEIDINPSHINDLDLFFNYYLPKTKELLGSYIDLERKQVKTDGITMVMNEIEGHVKNMSSAFKKILRNIYQQRELEILSEIQAMEFVMKSDGL